MKNSFRENNWVFALAGTAIGAGILYLPLQVGRERLLALLMLAPVVFLLTLLAHKHVARMLLLGRGEQDYTGVVARQLGPTFGVVCTLTFLLTFFSVLASYSIGLNSNLGEYLYHEGVTKNNWGNGPLLSLCFLGGFALLNAMGQKLVLRLMSLISATLILALLLLSIYFIPHWHLDGILAPVRPLFLLDDLLLLLPLLTFSFGFFPAMPSMLMELRQTSGNTLPGNTVTILNRVVLKTTITLFAFILLFVISTVFLLSPEEIQHASDDNLNCLTIFSHRPEISPSIAHAGVLIGLAALTTSFVGVYFAVRDCIADLVRRLATLTGLSKRAIAKTQTPIVTSIMLAVWLVTIRNPPVLDTFGYVIAPLVAIFMFILPLVILIKQQGRATLMKPASIFVLAMGSATLIAYALGTWLGKLLAR